MSKIKDTKTAKEGLSSLFGKPTTASGDVSIEKTDLSSKEEIEETLGEETREALKREVERRKYLKAGRPPKGTSSPYPQSSRMTFLLSPEKQEKIREIALRKGLFIKEVLDRGIDLVIEEFEREEGKL